MAPGLRAALLLLAASLGARAAVLYKSVSPDGVVEFSDLPPDKNRLVDRIQLSQDGIPTMTPHVAPSPSTDPVVDMDGAVARASAQLDLAEHALALARQPFSATSDPLRLRTVRPARSDVERIEYFKRGVIVARQNLMEVLKRTRTASQQTLTASAEPPAGRR